MGSWLLLPSKGSLWALVPPFFPHPYSPHSSPLLFFNLTYQSLFWNCAVTVLKASGQGFPLPSGALDGERARIPIAFQWPAWGVGRDPHCLPVAWMGRTGWERAKIDSSPLGCFALGCWPPPRYSCLSSFLIRQLSVVYLLAGPSRHPVRYSQAKDYKEIKKPLLPPHRVIASRDSFLFSPLILRIVSYREV